MKVQEVRGLSLEELHAKTAQLRRQYLEMRMQRSTQPAAVKSSDLLKLRRDIARLLTISRAKEKGGG